MDFPWLAVASVSALGSSVLSYAQNSRSWGFLAGSFAFVWYLQVTVWFTYSAIVYPYFLSPLRHLPEPAGSHWLMGQATTIRKEPTGAPARRWVQEIPHKGLIRYRWFFNRERVLPCSAKALAEVLVTKSYSFQKPAPASRFLSRVLGDGLLVVEGDEHKHQRRQLMPAFSFRHVKNLYPVFWSKARESVLAMTAEVGGRKGAEMEVSNWASRVGLDIIGTAGMGRDFGAIQDAKNPLVESYNKLFVPTGSDRILFILGFVIPFTVLNRLPFQSRVNEASATKKIKSVCRELIAAKKAILARGEKLNVDILSVAMESGGFTDEDLVSQMMTFLAAGHETTASAISWAVYTLCRYPEIQQRLREEIRERLPAIDDDREVTSSDIDTMPYLNAFCNEVLRYWSPVPQTVREASHDTTILGQPIPKGTIVFISPKAVNVDPELWGPDAGEFKPERWLRTSEDDKAAASGGATSNYAFLSFLHGPRSCIGQGFAKAEFACVLAAWVGRFQFEFRDEEDADESKLDIRGGLTARLYKGMHVKMTVLDGF
ncbi:cytochrome P450 [Stachybotrys elegans]|uniref:Cytochrome P450 n=1 Tax=Stachybotrys elegans TaxID=80388 RepID=A0A8K0SYG0_9HYPO|nr:cytochrome P450 [Stachybotrys elegans]